MDEGLVRYFELLEQRLTVMRQLALALEQGQPAVVSMDAENITRQSSEQQTLCRAWRLVEDEIQLQHHLVSTRGRGTVGFPGSLPWLTGPALDRWNDLGRELRQVEARMGYLNRVHTALLRNMRRSISVLANLCASADITYTAQSHEAGLALEMRE